MPAVTVESTLRLPRIPESDPHTTEQRAVRSVSTAPKGTPWHPHRGFETVTYIIDGCMEHQDSYGGGVITDGDVDVLILGGLPIREPVAHRGPFVMNTQVEIRQAIEDFDKRRLGFENAAEN